MQLTKEQGPKKKTTTTIVRTQEYTNLGYFEDTRTDFIRSRAAESDLHDFVRTEEEPKRTRTKWYQQRCLCFFDKSLSPNYRKQSRNWPSIVTKLLSKLFEFEISHVLKREDIGRGKLLHCLSDSIYNTLFVLPSFLLRLRQSNCTTNNNKNLKATILVFLNLKKP